MNYFHQKLATPIGSMVVIEKSGRIQGVVFQNTWPSFRKRFAGSQEKKTPVLAEAKRQLAEYFAGRRRSFDLPLELTGTAFQNKVWQSLAGIPYSETRTYKQQAQSIQMPRAVRAVGRTNGSNPICVVLPCHRVIGSDGSLTGYAGGLNVKKFLLQLEAPSNQ